MITRATLSNFRNYKELVFTPHPTRNIIYGNNGQGKTNLLEALYVCLRHQSFRPHAQYSALMMKEAQRTIVSVKTKKDRFDFQLEQQENTVLAQGKKNNITFLPLKDFETPALVVFSPNDAELLSDSAGSRGRFLNHLLAAQNPVYKKIINRYYKVLTQRNALLRSIRINRSPKAELFFWNNELAKQGFAIMRVRKEFLAAITSYYQRSMGVISGEKTGAVRYLPSAEAKSEEYLLHILEQNSSQDIEKGMTTIGPHRDDLGFYIAGRNLQNKGSRGEQRTAVLAFLIAFALWLQKTSQRPVIYLLDDVFSELDPKRQQQLLEALGGAQIFITTTQEEKDVSDAVYWYVYQGTITNQNV